MPSYVVVHHEILENTIVVTAGNNTDVIIVPIPFADTTRYGVSAESSPVS
jgi:hypothetical protein